MLYLIDTASDVVSEAKGYVLRIFSWAAFLLMLAIFLGYLIAPKYDSYHKLCNYVLAPFGLLFFYLGRWCIFMAGARYKISSQRVPRQNGRQHRMR